MHFLKVLPAFSSYMVATLLALACVPGASNQQPMATPAATVVKVGASPASSNAGVYIGMDRGYFKQEGLDVQLVNFGTSVDVVGSLSTGELDVVAGGLNPGLFNAVTRGVGIKLVADKGSILPGFGWLAFLVRKDTYDSGKIRSIKDLKGKKIGENTPGGVSSICLADALRTAGLKLDDVDEINLTFPDMVPSLINGSIDMASSGEPYSSMALQDGTAVNLGWWDQFCPGFQTSAILFSDSFASRHQDAAKRWMVGYVKAIRDYNDAFLKGKDKDAVLGIIAKYTGMKDTSVLEKTVPTGLNPDGYVNTQSLEVWPESPRWSWGWSGEAEVVN